MERIGGVPEETEFLPEKLGFWEEQEAIVNERYWSAGNIVAVVCFVSVALLPWVFLWWRGESLNGWDLAAASVAWLLIGTFAAANAASWRKKP